MEAPNFGVFSGVSNRFARRAVPWIAGTTPPWQPLGVVGASTVAAALVRGIMYAMPFIPSGNGLVLQALGIRATSSDPGTTFRLAVYDSDPFTNGPGRFRACGIPAVFVNGQITISPLTFVDGIANNRLPLEDGKIYWAVYCCDGGASDPGITLVQASANSVVPLATSIIGVADMSGAGGNGINQGLSIAQAGTPFFPDVHPTFPTGALPTNFGPVIFGRCFSTV